MASETKLTKAPPADLSAQTRVKKTYRKPQLNNFGKITELTAAGSGTRSEQMPGMGASSKMA